MISLNESRLYARDECERINEIENISSCENALRNALVIVCGMQLSNPPVLCMASLLVSLKLFDEAGGMAPL